MSAQLITDGECGFCQRSAAWLHRHFPGNWVNTPSQTIGLELVGISAEQANAKVWYVTGLGANLKSYGGAQAVAKLLLDQSKIWIKPMAALAFIPVTKQIAAGLYLLIAKNRKLFGTCES
jgi:predicted DCC family thiol-disulfide oxidoreductase YuxK